MRSHPTPDGMRAWRAFLETHARTMRTLEEELKAGTGMPLGWYDVLVHLSESPEHALRMAELADAVLLSRSGLTRLVDRMANAGLVQREPATNDRRGTYVILTPQGMNALRRAAPLHLEGVQRHFAGYLSEEAHMTLASMLEGILASERRDGSRGNCQE